MIFNSKEYYIVFDTNVLFHSYEKKADYTSFSFNATFKNVLDLVNQYDIYEDVTFLIPEVTWNEMRKQIIESYEKKRVDYQSFIKKWILPDFVVKEIKLDDYESYISEKISQYRDELKNGVNKIDNLPLPSTNRFESIINRAFEKLPPFEGKEKKSDKGFKDVLIWESILELIEKHRGARILFYSNDNIFSEQLKEEFSNRFSDAYINICRNEEEVSKQIVEWTKEIDIYKYHPVETMVENRDITEWLESADFELQMIDRDFGVITDNRFVISTYIHLIEFDNVAIEKEEENLKEYSVDVLLEVGYVFQGNGAINEKINVRVIIESFLGERYVVKDAWIIKDNNL